MDLTLGVRNLFSLLPRQSSLRGPLVRVLLDQVRLEKVQELNLPLKIETVKRYRAEEVDISALLVKRRKVSGNLSKDFLLKERLASEWIVDECGITQSGRKRRVFKTPLRFTGLFRQYQDQLKEQAVSINIFARLAKQHHVHFRVGAVDTMTCVNCRGWKSEMESVEVKLGNKLLHPAVRTRLKNELTALGAQLESHVNAFLVQFRCWKSDLECLFVNTDLCLMVVDFSTFELMDRKTTSVFCATLVFSVNGKIRREYFDFVDVLLSGRKRDMFYFAVTLLYNRGVFANFKRVRIWSDAGSSDFRNAPCLYSFLILNEVCKSVRFESFNFFGARHGWNDCDRHFGVGKQALDNWMVEVASFHKELLLDVSVCASLLSKLRRTCVFVCTKSKIHGIMHKGVKNLTNHYCFRATDCPRVISACSFSDSVDGQDFSLEEGYIVKPSDADAEAKKRKAKK